MNRYHNKFHRHNHHTDVTSGDNDSQNDPIASENDPFQGTFYTAGDIVFTGNNNIGSNAGTLNMSSDLNISTYIIQGYTLSKVTDVETTTSSDGEVLTWDSTANSGSGAWINSTASLSSISDITDVTISGEQLKEAIIWDGSGWVNGYPYAVYADLAENYTVDGSVRVGNIVAASSGRFGAEICSRKNFDKLLGVISENPGMLLDADLPHGHPVAYIGKVNILVSGKCKKGDIIVLSKIDGVGKSASKFDKKYKIGYAMGDSYESCVSPVWCVLKTM